MLVWKTWTKKTRFGGGTIKDIKQYRMLLLFGFIPIFISIKIQ